MQRFKNGKLLDIVDSDEVTHAIRSVEAKSSVRVYVEIAPLFSGDVQCTATGAFQRLANARPRDEKSVLFFVAPARNGVALIGDVEIQEGVGEELWYEVAGEIANRFTTGELTEGLVEGIGRVGQALARHFPRRRRSETRDLVEAFIVRAVSAVSAASLGPARAKETTFR